MKVRAMRTLFRWFNTLPSSPLHLVAGTVLSTIVGSAAYFAIDNTIAKDADENFASLVRSAQSMILGKIKSYSDVLVGAASLIHAYPEISGDDFHGYVNGLDLKKKFPGIDTVNFAAYVTEAGRPAFERRMGLATTGSQPHAFSIKPPGPRPEYLVLTYFEPNDSPRRKLIGTDLLARRPNAISTMYRSRDTGEVSGSGVPIALENGNKGLAMRLAVYRPGMPISTVEQRRAAFMGSVGIGFEVNNLMKGVLAELPVNGLRMRLTAEAPAAEKKDGDLPVLLYDSARTERADSAAPQPDELITTVPIEFSERNWKVQVSIKKARLLTALDFYAPWLALGAGFLSTALLYALFQTLSSSRRHAIRLAEEMTKELRDSETNLQNTNAKLRELAAHADSIKESERKRIAREIHDELGQNLLALRIEADLLSSRTGERHPLLHERAQRTLQQIDATIKSVRQIINDLRPNVLDLGLNAAVGWQIAEFQRRTNIRCELLESHREVQLDDRCATPLFRILQESLTNISKHANATHARVELSTNGDTVSMSIIDNGIGLCLDGRHKPGSYGLVGIEERIKILGGTCSIRNHPAGGTIVSVTVPVIESPTVPDASLTEILKDAFV